MIDEPQAAAAHKLALRPLAKLGAAVSRPSQLCLLGAMQRPPNEREG